MKMKMMMMMMMMKGAIKRGSNCYFVAAQRGRISWRRYFNNRTGNANNWEKCHGIGFDLFRLNIARYFWLSVKTDWERRRSRVCNQVLTLLKTSLGIKSRSWLVVEMPLWTNFTCVQCAWSTIKHETPFISNLYQIFCIKILSWTSIHINGMLYLSNYYDVRVILWSSSTCICDPRRTINFVHCTILVPLSLGSSSQNQRQQRSGDRLRHWIPKVLSHVTRKLPIFTYQAVDLFFANIMLRPRICVPFKIFIVRWATSSKLMVRVMYFSHIRCVWPLSRSDRKNCVKIIVSARN